MGVVLDVVYNHLGPEGNYLCRFSDDYFSRGKPTDWGDAINFDGKNSRPVREYVLSNARYWVEEFHFDGLRLDATQSIYDESEPHILAEIGASVREAAGTRGTLLIAENEPQRARLVRSRSRGGYGLDALWNDDYHHSAMVALTGKREAYYTDYRGSPRSSSLRSSGVICIKVKGTRGKKAREASLRWTSTQRRSSCSYRTMTR